MKHSSRIVFHFGLFKVEIFGLIIRNASRHRNTVTRLCARSTATASWPVDVQIAISLIKIDIFKQKVGEAKVLLLKCYSNVLYLKSRKLIYYIVSKFNKYLL